MRIALVGATTPIYELVCWHWWGMKDALEKSEHEWEFFSCRPELNIDELSEFKPDLILYGLRDIIANEEKRKEVRKRNPDAKIWMWYCDLRTAETQLTTADCSEMDGLLITNRGQEDFYKKKWGMNRVIYQPMGSPIIKGTFQKKLAFPFVFVGGKYGGALAKRMLIISELEKKNGLKIINSVINSNNPNIRKKIYESLPNLYYSSTVTLDVANYWDIDGYTSNRYWQVSAFGGFPLTKRFPGCEEFYDETERVYFDTIEECIEKKNFYTANPDERLPFIEKSLEKAKKHTYHERLKQIVAKVSMV